MKRIVEIDARKLCQAPKLAHAYLEELFQFPAYYGRNLDALYDCLSECGDEIEIVLRAQDTSQICQNPYAYRILMVIGKAADENPRLHLRFRR